MAFYDCESLESVIISDSVKSIGERAFANCDNLTVIVIPDSVASIGERAFANCDNLTVIVIPDSVASIGEHVFSGCNNLTTIYCEADEKPEGWSSFWNYGVWDAPNATVVWGYKGGE